MAQTTDDIQGVAAANVAYAGAGGHPLARLRRWTLRLAGQVRRQYLCRFRAAYVLSMRRLRRGVCRYCGSCCDLTFHCPFLTFDSQCTRYEKRSLTCRDFPIDALDLRLTGVPCGHYFERPPEGDPCADSAG